MSLQEPIEAGAEPHLAQIYRAYIACLNQRDWERLALFVDADVIHNSHRLGLLEDIAKCSIAQLSMRSRICTSISASLL